MKSKRRHKPTFFRIVFRKFLGLFRLRDSLISSMKLPSLIDDLEQARREWRHASLYFNNVTDPDLIDYAIFYMDAAEKKYIYLLKQAKEVGFNTEGFNLG